MGFVALYSNLAHKELRFLFPALPLLNLSAAAALARIRDARSHGIRDIITFLVTFAAISAGIASVLLAVIASRHNYPGGSALHSLTYHVGAEDARRALASGQVLNVHIDVLPAMTGVSRFGEAGKPWNYSKQEGLSPTQITAAGFHYLLNAEPEFKGFEQIAAIQGFTGIKIASKSPRLMLKRLLNGQLPLTVTTAPAVYIHRLKKS